jgi:hypothetical protein
MLLVLSDMDVPLLDNEAGLRYHLATPMQYMRRNGIEFAEMDQEVLLYDPAHVKFCALNATAGFVWDRLATLQSFDALVSSVSRTFVVSPETAHHDVQDVLRQLIDLSFIEAEEGDALESPSPVKVGDERRTYITPNVRQMDEIEVLSEFQVTSAGMSWWAM